MDGLLFLEADPRQHQAILHKAKHHGLHEVETRGFIIVLRFVGAER